MSVDIKENLLRKNKLFKVNGIFYPIHFFYPLSMLCFLRIGKKKEDFGSWNLRDDAKVPGFFWWINLLRLCRTELSLTLRFRKLSLSLRFKKLSYEKNNKNRILQIRVLFRVMIVIQTKEKNNRNKNRKILWKLSLYRNI